jgi:cell division protein FtsW
MVKKIIQADRKRVRSLQVLITILLLLGLGIVMVYDSSVAEGQRLFGDKFYFVKRHLIWVVLGIISMAVVSKIPISFIKKVSPYLFGLSAVMLAVVLIPGLGSTAQGARRWFYLGKSVYFQPSELVKLSTVLYFAVWLKNKQKVSHPLILLGAIIFLLILQPDFGTAIIIAAAGFLMLFVSGMAYKNIAWLFLACVVAGLGLSISAPYRMERIKTFLDPTKNPYGSSYHINQALIAFGSGGWWGLGIGRSRQKFEYLPEASTDSIFAVAGEELGFVGATAIVLLFVLLYWQFFRIAMRENDDYRRLLAVGLSGWLSIQTLVNLGSLTALMPMTGVPLPFISYGGSSLIIQMLTLGILLRINLTQR